VVAVVPGSLGSQPQFGLAGRQVAKQKLALDVWPQILYNNSEVGDNARFRRLISPAARSPTCWAAFAFVAIAPPPRPSPRSFCTSAALACPRLTGRASICACYTSPLSRMIGNPRRSVTVNSAIGLRLDVLVNTR
jgi:hypothetical protein